MAENKKNGAPAEELLKALDIEALKAQLKEEIRAEMQAMETPAPAVSGEELPGYWDEPVQIKLFKDNKDYKDDVFVGVNGKGYQIKRGIPVEVPRKVARVLENQERQDLQAAKTTEALQSEFMSEAQRLGI